MKLDAYIEKGGQKLRLGYTTGSCAAAAAKAAAGMLLTGQRVSAVRLRTPAGMELLLDIEDVRYHYLKNDEAGDQAEKNRPENTLYSKNLPAKVSCAVRKDSGDDPDITNQILIYAEVSRSEEPGIRIEGGEGIGRVTKQGLDQPVGNAAINSTPRKMIAEAVLEAAKGCSGAGGFLVTISAPEGRALAAKTFNPRLGIEGGISILGTSGIVEPMSDRALLDTIWVEIRVRKEEGLTIVPVVPGNYGKAYFMEKYGFSLETAVTSSNFIYDTVRMAVEAGFTRMLFTGHIGKLVKVAGGIRNTHSQYGDHRMEILTGIAEEILGDRQDAGNIREALSDCVMTDEAVRILRERDLDRAVLGEMTRRIRAVMQEWAGGRMQVEVIVFSNQYGELGRTDGALEYMKILKEERSESPVSGR